MSKTTKSNSPSKTQANGGKLTQRDVKEEKLPKKQQSVSPDRKEAKKAQEKSVPVPSKKESAKSVTTTTTTTPTTTVESSTSASPAKKRIDMKEDVIFRVRESLLEDFGSRKIEGMRAAMTVLGFLYLIADFGMRYIKTGEIMPVLLYQTFQRDFLICLLHWPLFYAFAQVSFFLQKAILLGLPEKVAHVLQHIFECLMFLYTYVIIITRDWCTTHSTFIAFHCCVHFFKMHSYRRMNAIYRQTKNACYPENVSFFNFNLYMWMPVLVYEPSYPRTDSIRWKYIVWKGFACFSGLTLVYLLSASLLPHLVIQDGAHWFATLSHIVFPFAMITITLFWIVFENILNVFAEITRFGDRCFYQDWWNSTTFEEYNRKWNRPVHTFLYRHVYLECMERYQFSKKAAQITTFVFSAILHEWVFCLVFRSVMPVMTLFMLFQIPLFVVTKKMQGSVSGNYLFWFGITVGPSVIITSYLHLNLLVLRNE